MTLFSIFVARNFNWIFFSSISFTLPWWWLSTFAVHRYSSINYYDVLEGWKFYFSSKKKQTLFIKKHKKFELLLKMCYKIFEQIPKSTLPKKIEKFSSHQDFFQHSLFFIFFFVLFDQTMATTTMIITANMKNDPMSLLRGKKYISKRIFLYAKFSYFDKLITLSSFHLTAIFKLPKGVVQTTAEKQQPKNNFSNLIFISI